MSETRSAAEANPWTTDTYPREAKYAGFDRLINFTDAVYAIALTLAALEIGLPEIDGESSSASALWHATLEKGPKVAAFVVAFIWVAIYWRANHKFTATLRAVNGRFIVATLIYLAFVALLPWPAEMLGEYWSNPVAISIFAVFVACVSSIEVVMFYIAFRDRLFSPAPSKSYARQQMVGAATPVAIFLLSIPLAFVATWLAIVFWLVGSVAVGFAMSRLLTAEPPTMDS